MFNRFGKLFFAIFLPGNNPCHRDITVSQKFVQTVAGTAGVFLFAFEGIDGFVVLLNSQKLCAEHPVGHRNLKVVFIEFAGQAKIQPGGIKTG